MEGDTRRHARQVTVCYASSKAACRLHRKALHQAFFGAGADTMSSQRHPTVFERRRSSGRSRMPLAPRRNLFFALVMGVGFLSTSHEARAASDDALQVLKAMSDYLTSQKTISSNFDSSLEVMTPQGEKIKFNSSGTILMQRPNELRATRTGGYADVELLLDGKTATLFGKNLNVYGQMDGIISIDQLIDTLRDRG